MLKHLSLNIFTTITLITGSLTAFASDTHAGPEKDTRQAITLGAEEKSFLLSEMRHFLVITQRILAASQQGDMQAVAKAAREGGLIAHQDDFANPDSPVHRIRKAAPPEFFPLGKGTHQAFDHLAESALQTGDKDVVNRLLAENLQRCVACHASYRVEEKR